MARATKGGLPMEITDHPVYRNIKLKLVTDKLGNFNCDGCIKAGAGTRYELSFNDEVKDLHICCAVMPARQRMLGDLEFQSNPPERSDGERKLCGACGKAVNHFVYYSNSCSIRYYHPCCATKEFKNSCKCTRPGENSSQNPISKHRNPNQN